MWSQNQWDALTGIICFTLGYGLMGLVCDQWSLRRPSKVSLVWPIVTRNMLVLWGWTLLLSYLWTWSIFLKRYTLHNVFFQWVVSLLLLEIWFYYAHRLLHHPKLYKKFHKQHHLFTEPYGWTAIYCGLVELLFVNHASVSLGPMLTGMTGWSIGLWFLGVAMTTVFSHSGIEISTSYIKWIGSKSLALDRGLYAGVRALGNILSATFSSQHDLHHKYFKYNYGVFNVMDWVHSTQYKPAPKEEKRTRSF